MGNEEWEVGSMAQQSYNSWHSHVELRDMFTFVALQVCVRISLGVESLLNSTSFQIKVRDYNESLRNHHHCWRC